MGAGGKRKPEWGEGPGLAGFSTLSPRPTESGLPRECLATEGGPAPSLVMGVSVATVLASFLAQ